MAFASWEINKSKEHVDVSLEIDEPIGTGSLHVKTDSISMASLRLRDVDNRAYTKGRVSTLFKPLAIEQNNHPSAFIGACSMMSRGDLYNAGSFYAAGMWNGEWVVLKVEAVGNQVTFLAHGATTNLPHQNKVQAMEFEWISNPEYGGVRLVLRVSLDENFENMQDIYALVDKNNSLFKSAGEGIVSFGESEALFAQTTVWELVPV